MASNDRWKVLRIDGDQATFSSAPGIPRTAKLKKAMPTTSRSALGCGTTRVAPPPRLPRRRRWGCGEASRTAVRLTADPIDGSLQQSPPHAALAALPLFRRARAGIVPLRHLDPLPDLQGKG